MTVWVKSRNVIVDEGASEDSEPRRIGEPVKERGYAISTALGQKMVGT